jgi:hypothetical protein
VALVVLALFQGQMEWLEVILYLALLLPLAVVLVVAALISQPQALKMVVLVVLVAAVLVTPQLLPLEVLAIHQAHLHPKEIMVVE